MNHKTKDLLRQAQAILSLLEDYEQAQLEQACQRAIAFNTYDYKTIRTMLKEGLEDDLTHHNVPEEVTRTIYSGQASFQRCAQDFIQ